VADAVLKDIMPQMEHPFYSLSKKPETKIRRYEHNGSWLEIIPSVKGLATIYDKDILIYCISQLMEKLKRGEPVGQRLRITSHDLLVFTNRGTAGKDYDALCEGIDRLAGTRITTNIRTGEEDKGNLRKARRGSPNGKTPRQSQRFSRSAAQPRHKVTSTATSRRLAPAAELTCMCSRPE
jgi:hypothetical protein